MIPASFEDTVAFVWKVADKLRGTFNPHEYGSAMLPLLVPGRMGAVLAPTRDAVRAKADTLTEINAGSDEVLKRAAGQWVDNTSPHMFGAMLGDDKNIAASLREVIAKPSPSAGRSLVCFVSGTYDEFRHEHAL